jgi:hypothetical protein
MVKFFRKIRQQLLTDNKYTKYLLYAIGEIILVVIGILIALSINNWNNQQINRSESYEFNRRLSKEIDLNLELADSKIAEIKSMISSSKGILDLFKKDPNDQDPRSLDSLIFLAISGVKTEFIIGTLSEGLNTGKVALIQSDELKSKLYGLPSNIAYVGEYDKTYSTYVGEILQPFLYENFNYRRMDNSFSEFDVGPSKFNAQESKTLLEDKRFENLIDNHFFQSNSQLRFHKNLRNEFAEVKKLIDEEFKTPK